MYSIMSDWGIEGEYNSVKEAYEGSLSLLRTLNRVHEEFRELSFYDEQGFYMFRMDYMPKYGISLTKGGNTIMLRDYNIIWGDKMRKYMILAKNDYNEEIFYTDIKKEAKQRLDELFDKYYLVKAYCYSYKEDMYIDITDLNTPSVYEVYRYKRGSAGEIIEKQEFASESAALRYIIISIRCGEHCKLYKNGRRDWSV